MASIIGIIVLALMISITALTYTSSPKNWWSATILPHVCGSDPLTEPVLFTINSQYMNLSYDANAYWDNLITPNGGFIRQLDSEGIMMKHGISMFHHLHCLQMIRAEIQRLMHLEQHHDAQRGSKDERIRETLSDEAHWTHCIDYIRQGILCAADGTIERPERGPDGAYMITGNRVTHKCRSSRSLYELSKKSGGRSPSHQHHHQDDK